MMTNRKQINVAIPGEELEKLRELAAELQISQSETVRALINNAYNSEIVKDYLKTTNAEMAARDALIRAGLDITSYNVHCVSKNRKSAPWKEPARKILDNQTKLKNKIALKEISFESELLDALNKIDPGEALDILLDTPDKELTGRLEDALRAHGVDIEKEFDIIPYDELMKKGELTF